MCGQGSKDPKVSRSQVTQRLLAHAAEPPVIRPTAGKTADRDGTLMGTTVEGDEAPLTFRILPMSTVRMLISEFGVGLVDCRHHIRIGF